MEITKMRPADWPQVEKIYADGIATIQATFETKTPTWEAWDVGHLTVGRLVAREGDKVLGWTALSPFSKRAVYAGVTEVSVYISEEARGKGLGGQLLRALIADSEANGIWLIQAKIFRENEASVRLHLRHGFREVGYREKIAKQYGVWRDVVLLERRSGVVGID